MPRNNRAAVESDPLKEVDIAFFFCPYTGHPPPHRFDINHGPAYIAAFLKQHGFNSSFYYGRYDNDPSFTRILAYIERVTPRSIGFTVYGSNLPETTCLCSAIKEKYPDLPIIWGGPQIRFNPKSILETHKGLVDICVSGEGEMPLKQILEIPSPWKAHHLEKIPGLSCFNDGDNDIISNDIGQTLVSDAGSLLDKKKALDIYCSPFLDGIIPDEYFYDKSVFSIFTSRGCPYQCIYCQFSSLTDHKVLFHSVERVMAEIKWIHAKVKKYHPHKKEIMIMIFDEALTLSRKRIEILCNELVSNVFNPPLKLWVETRADHVDESLLAILKKAGVKKINFGLESAVPKVLKKICKVTNNTRRPADDVEAEKRFLKKIKKAVETSKSLGLFTSVSTIVGLPGETLTDAKTTLEFVKSLDVDMYYHNFLNVLDGTQLVKEAKELGYDWQSRPAGYMGKYGHRFTKAAVNTRSLMPLPNARIFIRDKARFKFLLRGYTKQDMGLKFKTPGSDSNSYAPFVLDLTECHMESSFIRDLFTKISGLSTTVFCRDDFLSGLPDFLELFHTLALKNGRLYLLPDERSTKNRIQSLEEADQSTPYYLPFKMGQDHKAGENGRSLFLTIDDKDDFEAFTKVCEPYFNIIETGRGKPGSDPLPFELFESCRWVCDNHDGCPAASLTHLYVDGQNAIKPCRHFPSMTESLQSGGIAPLDHIRKKTRVHIDNTLNKRGCRHCEIESVCPRCVAPFLLSEDAYCRFQKKRLAQTKK